MRIIGAICLSATFRLLRLAGGIWLAFPLVGLLAYSAVLLLLMTHGYPNQAFIMGYALFAFVVYAVPRPGARIAVALFLIILARAYWQSLPVTQTAEVANAVLH